MRHAGTSDPINKDILRAATDNDETVMKEVVLIYLRQGFKNVKELRSAVKREDSEKVAALAHRFLGSSRFVGATKIGVPLTKLMKMARSRLLRSIAAELVNRTEKEFIRIDRYLKVT